METQPHWSSQPARPSMIRMIEPIANETLTKPERDSLPAAPPRPSVDDMSEWSFPASDPPATWTWEVDS